MPSEDVERLKSFLASDDKAHFMELENFERQKTFLTPEDREYQIAMHLLDHIRSDECDLQLLPVLVEVVDHFGHKLFTEVTDLVNCIHSIDALKQVQAWIREFESSPDIDSFHLSGLKEAELDLTQQLFFDLPEDEQNRRLPLLGWRANEIAIDARDRQSVERSLELMRLLPDGVNTLFNEENWPMNFLFVAADRSDTEWGEALIAAGIDLGYKANGTTDIFEFCRTTDRVSSEFHRMIIGHKKKPTPDTASIQ